MESLKNFVRYSWSSSPKVRATVIQELLEALRTNQTDGKQTFPCHSFIFISSIFPKNYLIRHWKFWLIPLVNWFRCIRPPNHVDFSRHFWTKWFESTKTGFSNPSSMLSTFNHVLFVKSILSRWRSPERRSDAQVDHSSRNTRVQADYGLSYLSRVVVASQQGISSDEETDQLLVGEKSTECHSETLSVF